MGSCMLTPVIILQESSVVIRTLVTAATPIGGFEEEHRRQALAVGSYGQESVQSSIFNYTLMSTYDHNSVIQFITTLKCNILAQ